MPNSPGRFGLPSLRGQPGARSFFAAMVVDSIGVGLYIPVSLLYFTKIAGIPLGTVGWCLSVAGLLTLPLPLVIGRLVDRYGSKLVVVVGTAMQGVAFGGYLFVRSAIPLFVFALCAMIGMRLYWSSVFTLVADLAPTAERDRWYALGSASRNIGLGFGSLVAAGLLATGGTAVYQFVVGANAVTCLTAAALVAVRVPNREHHEQPTTAETPAAPAVSPLRDLPFMTYTVLNTVAAICVTMLGTGLPVYVDSGLHAPGWVVGALSAVNITLLAVVQTAVIHLVRKVRRSRVIVIAALLWAAWGGLMAVTFVLPSGWVVIAFLFVIMLAYCGAELLHGPTSSALAAEASPPAARGRYLSVFQLSFAIANVIAPAYFAQTFELHPTAPWLLLGVLSAIAAGCMLWVERRLPRRAVVAPQTAAVG
ncbi:MFS transporter [Flindersiella endophytica]